MLWKAGDEKKISKQLTVAVTFFSKSSTFDCCIKIVLLALVGWSVAAFTSSENSAVDISRLLRLFLLVIRPSMIRCMLTKTLELRFLRLNFWLEISSELLLNGFLKTESFNKNLQLLFENRRISHKPFFTKEQLFTDCTLTDQLSKHSFSNNVKISFLAFNYFFIL